MLQVPLLAKNIYKISHIPVSGKECAVLVLAPGINSDGAFFLSESEWCNFSKNNQLGLIALNYRSDESEIESGVSKWYYQPDSGSGQALLDDIKRIYGRDLPILIYGFSGGAQFASRLVDWCPDRIIAWCAYSAQFWDYSECTKTVTKARGIVACGEGDNLRWQPSFSFYYKGRSNNRPWMWISLPNTGHARNMKLENFVRNFFQEELAIYDGTKKAEKDIWSDISNRKYETTIPLPKEKSALQCPIRTKELFEEWKEIQTP